jgi:glycerol uptake facilitator-like aquaporin
MFNPAAALSQVVAGNLNAKQFFTVIAGEMAGAIIGGFTVYLLYMPQLYKAGAKVRNVTLTVTRSYCGSAGIRRPRYSSNKCLPSQGAVCSDLRDILSRGWS